MQSWRQHFNGGGMKGGWVGSGREEDKERLELAKMDALFTQISRTRRSQAELKETCLCIEELISKEEKEQVELESELKVTSRCTNQGQQHSITEANLQSSTEVIDQQIGYEERENKRLEEELETLAMRLGEVQKSKLAMLDEIKARYGNRLIDREKVEQQKRLAELKHRRSVLGTRITQLRQDSQTRACTEWNNFVQAVVKMAELQRKLESERKTVNERKTSIQILRSVIYLQQTEPSRDTQAQHDTQKDAAAAAADPVGTIPPSPHMVPAGASQRRVMEEVSDSQHPNASQDSGKETPQQHLAPDFMRTPRLCPSPSPWAASTPPYSPRLPVHPRGSSPKPAHSRFNTSCSFLRFPRVRFGEKRAAGKSSVDTQDRRGKMSPIFEAPTTTMNHPSPSLATTPEGPSHSLSSSSSSHNINPGASQQPSFSATYNQHETMTDFQSQSSGVKGNNLGRGVTGDMPSIVTSPVSLTVSSSSHAQMMQGLSPMPRDVRTSLSLPTSVGVPSLISRGVAVPLARPRGVGLSLLPRGVQVPLLRSRGARVPPPSPRSTGIPSTVPRGVGVPPSSPRGMGVSLLRPRGMDSLLPPENTGSPLLLPHQNSRQSYASPISQATDQSRPSPSCKQTTFMRTAQESCTSVGRQDEDAAPLTQREHTAGSGFLHVASTSAAATNTDDPSAGPSSAQSPGTAADVPQPMEVEKSCSSEDEAPLSSSQGFSVTDDSCSDGSMQQGDSSPGRDHPLKKYPKLSKEPHSSFMDSQSTGDMPPFSVSFPVQSSSLVSSASRSVTCVTPATSPPPPSPSLSEPKKTQPHSMTHTPPHTTVTPPGPVQLSPSSPSPSLYPYNLSPVIQSNQSQQFNNTSKPTAEDSSYPFMFQGGSQNSSGSARPLSLFGSPESKSMAQSAASVENSTSSFFLFDPPASASARNTNTALFSFNLGSDGESEENSGSSFFSSLFDSSQNTTPGSTSDDNCGFRLF